MNPLAWVGVVAVALVVLTSVVFLWAANEAGKFGALGQWDDEE